MSKEELIKATQILQKHVPNRFPLKNSYIEAMREYAEWYHEELSKLHQPTVSESVCEHKNIGSEYSGGAFLKVCLDCGRII